MNKNLAIANRSRIGCAHNTFSEGTPRPKYYTVTLKSRFKGHSRSLETEPLDRSYTTYY